MKRTVTLEESYCAVLRYSKAVIINIKCYGWRNGAELNGLE